MISVARKGSDNISADAIWKPAKDLSSDFNSRTATVIVSAKGIKAKLWIEIFTFSLHSGWNQLKNSENQQKNGWVNITQMDIGCRRISHQYTVLFYLNVRCHAISLALSNSASFWTDCKLFACIHVFYYLRNS